MENQITPLTFSEKNAASSFGDMKAGHVGIRTTQYDEILHWYQENLDFRIIHKWKVGEIKLAFIAPPNDNNFIIEIICYDSAENPYTETEKSGYNHLSFSVDNLDQTIEHLTKKNITINRSFSVPAIGLRVAFITDPFGNTIEFCDELK
ncbi:MAG: VOC family protein [Flavobacterium circumlabens]|uniref:VOC family protein n=1 Tax=Flavobacterium circumlabens TaxID=2133765 RepID=UPI0032676593